MISIFTQSTHFPQNIHVHLCWKNNYVNCMPQPNLSYFSVDRTYIHFWDFNNLLMNYLNNKFRQIPFLRCFPMVDLTEVLLQLNFLLQWLHVPSLNTLLLISILVKCFWTSEFIHFRLISDFVTVVVRAYWLIAPDSTCSSRWEFHNFEF